MTISVDEHPLMKRSIVIFFGIYALLTYESSYELRLASVPSLMSGRVFRDGSLVKCKCSVCAYEVLLRAVVYRETTTEPAVRVNNVD